MPHSDAGPPNSALPRKRECASIDDRAARSPAALTETRSAEVLQPALRRDLANLPALLVSRAE